jgi:hypothetical protein
VRGRICASFSMERVMLTIFLVTPIPANLQLPSADTHTEQFRDNSNRLAFILLSFPSNKGHSVCIAFKLYLKYVLAVSYAEADGRIWNKVFLLAIHSHLYKWILPQSA